MPEFASFTIFKQNIKNRDNSNENLKILFKSMYSYHKIKFLEWLENKKLSKKYIQSIISVLENTLFNLNNKNPIKLKESLAKVKNHKYRALAIRNWLNFLDEYELLDQKLILKLKAKIKITERSNIDTFIPSE